MFSTVKRAPRREKRKQNGTSGEFVTNTKTFYRATFQKGTQIPPGKCTQKSQYAVKCKRQKKQPKTQAAHYAKVCFCILVFPCFDMAGKVLYTQVRLIESAR